MLAHETDCSQPPSLKVPACPQVAPPSCETSATDSDESADTEISPTPKHVAVPQNFVPGTHDTGDTAGPAVPMEYLAGSVFMIQSLPDKAA